MFRNERLVIGDADTERLVAGRVSMLPLNIPQFRFHFRKHAVGFFRGSSKSLALGRADIRYAAFGYISGHDNSSVGCDPRNCPTLRINGHTRRIRLEA